MKGKFKLNHLIVHLILLVGVIVVVFPFAWMILTSFKTSGEAMKREYPKVCVNLQTDVR